MNIDNEQCPKCESYKLTKIGRGITFIAILGISGIFFWIGIFIWPLLLLSVLAFIASPIAFFVNTRVTCGGCGYQWEIDRKTGEVITVEKKKKIVQ